MLISGPMRDSNHVLADLFAAAHTGVVALRDDVGQPVIDRDFDLDVRVLAQELRELWQEDRLGGILHRCDANGARRFFAQFADRRKLGFDLLEPGP
jgi:hypothetical protein